MLITILFPYFLKGVLISVNICCIVKTVNASQILSQLGFWWLLDIGQEMYRHARICSVKTCLYSGTNSGSKCREVQREHF